MAAHPEVGSVIDNPDKQRFELQVDGETAFLSYRRIRGKLYLVHTEVPEALRGTGVGATLVRGVLDRARADGVQIVPYCPFVRRFLDDHPEYGDLVAGSVAGEEGSS